jgi:hypothetical protein
MILTVLEAKAYRAEQFANYRSFEPDAEKIVARPGETINNYSSTVSLAGANIYVRDQTDIRALAMELNSLQTAQWRALGRV